VSRREGDPRRLLWMAGLAYTVLVIYGSLVPPEFRSVP